LNYSDKQPYGRLMLDVAGRSLCSDEEVLLRNPHVGGVILFSRNLGTPEQVIDLVCEIRACSSNLLIAVDQEGGRVQRLCEKFSKLPTMQTLGDFLDKESSAGLSLCHDVGWLMASEVLACGLDISFAPVLDVDRDTSSIIGDRSFSNNPETVIVAAKAFIEGMNEAGMASTGKHFPGHGGIFADSHLEAPVDSRGWEQMESHDLKPFRALANNLGGIMPAHITFPAIDPFSVGFSSYWLREILRQKLGFKGVIFSDDLTMKGADVAGGYESKAKMALDAGCDMILVCNCPEGAVEVLSYMEKQNVPQNDKIGAMRSSKSVAWSDLEQSPRRLAVIEKLSSVI